MRTFNLSPDTLLNAEDAHEVPHMVIDVGADKQPLYFVKASKYKGLLPKILDTLITERSKVKEEMASETDQFRRSLLNAKQLALKISANSVYGACGATKGLLQCRQVAEATTAKGREIIAFTKMCIETRFRIPGCTVIYGDTDSAFVRLPPEFWASDAETIYTMGVEMAKFVTNLFIDELPSDLRSFCHVCLEMEKFLRPVIFYKKKRYVGKSFEQTGKKGKTLVKGLELVRRDAVPLVKKVQKSIIEALLDKEDPSLAVKLSKEAIEEIIDTPHGGPFDHLTLSKSLRNDYKNPEGIAHLVVAKRMDHRDSGSAPRIGDRVEYMIVASRAERVVDRAEEVKYAEANSLPPDWYFYLESLERPVLRLLEVPLQFFDCRMYEELMSYFQGRKLVALEKQRRHCMARIECRKKSCMKCEWTGGLPTKSGAVQRRLADYLNTSVNNEAAPNGSQPANLSSVESKRNSCVYSVACVAPGQTKTLKEEPSKPSARSSKKKLENTAESSNKRQNTLHQYVKPASQ